MSARDELIDYLTPLLRGAFLLDSEAQARAGARALVGRLTYVAAEHDDVETTTLSSPERGVIRQKWIVVKIPNGTERLMLPYEQDGDDR